MRALGSLLTDSDDNVQCWAASHLLQLDDERAEQALEAIAGGDDIISFGAEMVLREWRAGRLSFP